MVSRGRDQTPSVLNGPGTGAAAFMAPPGKEPVQLPYHFRFGPRAPPAERRVPRGGIRGSPPDGHQQRQRTHRARQPST
jgi:hypothetical protein